MEGDPGQTEYFSSYEDLEVHKLMLEDKSRTETYRNAILSNKDYFTDKIVMDVGCGTGILAVFCAQAGAKKVYAVEASSLANMAKEIVKENGYDEVIEVIHGKVEDVELPDNIKVDAIVSEWMGFYLLHEGMLDSVIVARDKFLKEDGHIFPNTATIYIAPCSVPSLYSAWSDVYGVSMATFARHLRSTKCKKPEVLIVKPEDLLSAEVAVCWIDLKNDKVEDLNSFSIQQVIPTKTKGQYQGLCIWFDCTFPSLTNNPGVTLGTGPMDLPTHWKQTVIVLPQEHEVDEGEPIAFQLDINKDTQNCRRYNLQLTLVDPEEVEHPLPCDCHYTKCILIKTYMLAHPERDVPCNGIVDESVPMLEQDDGIVEENIDDDG
ncbi:probable protein arginine N-methyltransferase 6.1 [Hyposmocoma kahamanoa]|uniref:probable protein arginine N-methyltransferase 6.1 n=1 Tax=Hyposmocoma kahamanoa TaxID=1477025 RepID=UPI000E6D9C28|nr:probable protein arginine N-methyltransferase 6.1 [Hyposmocoma kahamanoa]